MTTNALYVGTKSQVVALDRETGRILWRTKLGGALTSGTRFVTLLAEGPHVFVHTNGEIFCLAASSGEILWKNGLEGMGYDFASLAVVGQAVPPTPTIMQRQARASSGD
jgi:outer membrane protein assembly factor BamB